MPLLDDQHSETNIRLISAKSREYSLAKIMRRLRILISVVVALSTPIAAHEVPALTNYLAIAAGVWLLLSTFILKRIENTHIQTGATIQEEFDTKLFGLPWNKVLVGDPVTKELVINASSKFSGDRGALRNWYPDTSSIAYPMSVLLCQRSNLVWDWRLKRSYGYFVGIITGLFLVAGIVIAVATDQKMLDYILKFFVPSLSVFVLGAEASKAHLDVAKSKQQKEKEINAMMELSKKQPGSVTTQECRQLQDYIFSLRCKDALVPNWWYRKLRWRYEMDMQKAAEEIGNEASTSSEKRI